MGTLVEWNDQYSVNDDVLDDHHKKLFETINLIATYFENGKDSDSQKIAGYMDELIEYTDYHFKLEEAVLKQVNYPDTDKHIKQHEIFEVKVKSFRDQVLTFGSSNTSKRILEYLTNWLKSHIVVEDAKYAAFRREKS